MAVSALLWPVCSFRNRNCLLKLEVYLLLTSYLNGVEIDDVDLPHGQLAEALEHFAADASDPDHQHRHVSQLVEVLAVE